MKPLIQSVKDTSVSDYYDHIIRCHLSLPAPPRERFAKVAQPCCNSTVPVVRPFAVEHVSRRGPDEGGDKNEMARPLRPEECHRKPEAGGGLGAHLAIPG